MPIMRLTKIEIDPNETKNKLDKIQKVEKALVDSKVKDYLERAEKLLEKNFTVKEQGNEVVKAIIEIAKMIQKETK